MTSEDVLTPEGFEAAYREHLQAKIKVYPARSWYPSQAGHPCDRFLVWRFTRFEEQAKHDVGLQAIFDEGNVHQPAVYQTLEGMGFDVIREGDRPSQWKLPGGAVISGRIDGKLRAYKGTRYPAPLPLLEIKTMQGWGFDKIHTISDVLKAEAYYVRGYYTQNNLCMILENTPQTLMVLKNKGTGWLKLIPQEIDFERGEETVARIERLDRMVKAKEDPPPIPFDPGICGRCAFGATCYPPREAGEGVVPIEDTVLLDDLQRRAALDPGRKEYDDLDKSVKERLKKLVGPGQTGMLGEFTAEIREVPKHFKAAAERDTTEIHVVIRRVGG